MGARRHLVRKERENMAESSQKALISFTTEAGTFTVEMFNFKNLVLFERKFNLFFKKRKLSCQKQQARHPKLSNKNKEKDNKPKQTRINPKLVNRRHRNRRINKQHPNDILSQLQPNQNKATSFQYTASTSSGCVVAGRSLGFFTFSHFTIGDGKDYQGQS